MKKSLKLYIWTGFAPDWSDGLAFAIASSEEEAKELVLKEIGYEPNTWGDLEIRRLDWRVAKAVSGGG